MTQIDKCKTFHALHRVTDPLTLYNIWDVASAKMVEGSGAKAIATGSWGVATAHGYPDGQGLPLSKVIQTITAIVEKTSLPVSLDFEGGYAPNLDTLAANGKTVFGTGIVGVNFEDQTLPALASGPSVHDLAVQCERIACLRHVADEMGVPIFINARTDLFLQSDVSAHVNLVADAIARAQAYVAAGASGVFVPGLVNIDAIAKICGAVSAPVNVMASSNGTDLGAIIKAGARRISYGPHPYRAVMANFKAGAEAIYAPKA